MCVKFISPVRFVRGEWTKRLDKILEISSLDTEIKINADGVVCIVCAAQSLCPKNKVIELFLFI